MGEDTATRIATADGGAICLALTGSGTLARLRLYNGDVLVVAVLDRDDLDALADACTTLAEEIAGLPTATMPCECEECVAARNAVI